MKDHSALYPVIFYKTERGERINVHELVKNYLKKYRYVCFQGVFYRYFPTEGIWKICSKEDLKKHIARFLNSIRDDSWSVGVRESVMELLSVKIKPVNKMNIDDKKICLKNYVVDMETGKSYKFSPQYYFTTNVSYSFNPEAKCPRFNRFLKEITCRKKLRRYTLEEFMGYALTTHVKCGCILVLIGSGQNGKSVYVNILKELVGEKNCTSVTVKDLSERFERGKLVDKKLAVISEISKRTGKQLMSNEMKQIATGEQMNGDRKYGKPFDFRPYAKVVVMSNHELDFSEDSSEGAKRRVLIVPFEYHVPEKAKDNDLEETLKEEISGIFNLALEGYRRLVSNRYKFSYSELSRKRIEAIIGQSNPLADFITNGMEHVIGSRVFYKDLRGAYEEWCRQKNITAICPDSKTFFREIKKVHEITAFKSSKGRGIENISLK